GVVFDGTNSGTTFGVHGSFNGLAIQSSSSEDVFGLVPAVGGGFVGAAGGIGVTILSVITKAYVGPSSSINQAGGADPSQSVNVSAIDLFKSLTVAGGVGIGFVGVAGGVDVGFANSSVQAYIGGSSTVGA